MRALGKIKKDYDGVISIGFMSEMPNYRAEYSLTFSYIIINLTCLSRVQTFAYFVKLKFHHYFFLNIFSGLTLI